MAEEIAQPRTQNKIYLQTGANAGPSTELHYGDLIYNKDGTLNTVDIAGFPIALAQQTAVDELRKDTKNKLDRKADLDDNGLVPASQLPSYVDDVMEYENKNAFPRPGEPHKVYVDVTTNMTYRWSGSDYVIVGNDLALGETAATAYAGDKGKANAEKIAAILNGTLQVEDANKLDGLEGSEYLTKVEYDALDKNQVIVSAEPPSSKIATVWYPIIEEKEEDYSESTIATESYVQEQLANQSEKTQGGSLEDLYNLTEEQQKDLELFIII